MANRRMFTLEFDPKSLSGMYRLADNVAKYPNRIQRAKTVAAEKTKSDFKNLIEKHYSKGRSRAYMYKDDKVLPVQVNHGRTKTTMTIKVLKADVGGNNTIDEKDRINKAKMDVNIRMYGRRRYSGARGPYSLVGNAHPAARKYPQLISTFSVPARSPDPAFRSFILDMPVKLLRKNLREQLQKEGFGSRGGVRGMGADIGSAGGAGAKFTVDARR